MGTGESTMVRVNRPHKTPDTSTYAGRLAERIRKLRERAGLSIGDAAKRITKAGYSISASGVYKWENGQAVIPATAFLSVASAYGCKPRNLIPNE